MSIYEGNKPYIFISYSHADTDKVLPVIKYFDEIGLRYWFDYGIPKGSKWIAELGKHISGADVVLVFVSKTYIDSHWCGLEIDNTLQLEKKIIPCYLDDARSDEWDWCISRYQGILAKDMSSDELIEAFKKMDSLNAYVEEKIEFEKLNYEGSWGPKRPLYSYEDNYAELPVFNSAIDNPEIGDERRFVLIRDLGTDYDNDKDMEDLSGYKREIDLIPGHYYGVRVYYNNNANPELNPTGSSIAAGVRMRINVPEKIEANKSGEILASVFSVKPSPKEVWSKCFIKNQENYVLKLVIKPGSNKFNNKGKMNGILTPSSVFGENGLYLGHNKISGMIPGGLEYSGYISFKFHVPLYRAYVRKSVSFDGVNFAGAIDAKVGDELIFKTEFKNTGTDSLCDVVFHDKLDECLELIPGTTVLVSNARPDGLKMKDIIDKNGFNTGLYGKGATACITYKAKVVKKPSAPEKTVRNTSFVVYMTDEHSGNEVYAGASIKILE